MKLITRAEFSQCKGARCPVSWLAWCQKAPDGESDKQWKLTSRKLIWHKTKALCHSSSAGGWGLAVEHFTDGSNQFGTQPTSGRSAAFIISEWSEQKAAASHQRQYDQPVADRPAVLPQDWRRRTRVCSAGDVLNLCASKRLQAENDPDSCWNWKTVILCFVEKTDKPFGGAGVGLETEVAELYLRTDVYEMATGTWSDMRRGPTPALPPRLA